jgi:hypothetical protein
VEQEILNPIGIRIMHQEEDEKADIVRHLTQRLSVFSEKKVS